MLFVCATAACRAGRLCDEVNSASDDFKLNCSEQIFVYAASNESVARKGERERAEQASLSFVAERERERESACRAQVSWECSDAVCALLLIYSFDQSGRSAYTMCA